MGGRKRPFIVRRRAGSHKIRNHPRRAPCKNSGLSATPGTRPFPQTSLHKAAHPQRIGEHFETVTHDADFGTLAIHQGEPLAGLIYLRPAHIDPKFTIEFLQAVLSADPDVVPPFILVAKRSGNKITIRIRHLGP